MGNILQPAFIINKVVGHQYNKLQQKMHFSNKVNTVKGSIETRSVCILKDFFMHHKQKGTAQMLA